MNTKWIGYLWLITAWVVSATAGPAWCEDNTLITSVALMEKSNDNIFFTEDQRVSDTITVITPEIRWENRSEREAISLTGSVSGNSFSDNSELNAVDQFCQWRFQYGLTERFDLVSGGEYARDSLVDRDMEKTGLLFNSDERQRYRFHISPAYQWTENNALYILYQFNREDFDTDEYEDFQANGVKLGLRRTGDPFSAFMKTGVSLGYDRYDYPDAAIDCYSLSGDSETALGEMWRLKAGAGVRYVDESRQVRKIRPVFPPFYIVVTETERDKKWGGVGNISLSRSGERLVMSGTLSHDLQSLSGSNGMVERTSLSLHSAMTYSEEFQARGGARFFVNRSDSETDGTADIDQDSISLYSVLSWQFKKKGVVEFSYNHSRVENRNEDEEKDRNLFLLSFRYNFKQ